MPTHSTLAPAEAIDALLSAIEGQPGSGAVAAYRAAVTRHGANLTATAGPEALAAVLAHVRSAAPDKAAAHDRERIVLDAWAMLIPKDRAA